MKELFCPTCKIELMSHEAGPCLEEWLYGSMGFKQASDGVWRESESQYWRKGISFIIDDAFWFMQRKIWKIIPGAIITQDKIILGVWENMKSYHWVDIYGFTFPIRVCRAGIYIANQTIRSWA